MLNRAETNKPMKEQALFIATYWDGNERNWEIFVSDKGDYSKAVSTITSYLREDERIPEGRNDIEVYPQDVVWNYRINLEAVNSERN